MFTNVLSMIRWIRVSLVLYMSFHELGLSSNNVCTMVHFQTISSLRLATNHRIINTYIEVTLFRNHIHTKMTMILNVSMIR